MNAGWRKNEGEDIQTHGVPKTVAQRNLENELTALKQFNELFPFCRNRFIYDINCDETENFQRNVLNAIDICVLEELYPEIVHYRELLVDYAEQWHSIGGAGNRVMWRMIGNLNDNIEFLGKYIKEQKGEDND